MISVYPDINPLIEEAESLDIGKMILLGNWSMNNNEGLRTRIEARNITQDTAKLWGLEDSLKVIHHKTGYLLAEEYEKVWDDTIDAIENLVVFETTVPLDSLKSVSIDSTCTAARNALRALLVRDLIDLRHYDALTEAWRTIVGPIHPDDPDLRIQV